MSLAAFGSSCYLLQFLFSIIISLEFFHNFMKAELGQEEYEKTLNEEIDDDEFTKEFLDLFAVPGLGERSDDIEGIEEYMESLLTPEKDFENAKKALRLDNMDHEGVALKLVSYVFAKEGRKAYSLVKFLKPYVLIGKFASDEENDLRFELLTCEEERLILPRLEEECEKDLEKAGLSLTNKST